VKKVVASYMTGKATITFDDSVVTLEEIIEGYKRAAIQVMGEPEWIK
jgi:copper chaperone CopZ